MSSEKKQFSQRHYIKTVTQFHLLNRRHKTLLSMSDPSRCSYDSFSVKCTCGPVEKIPLKFLEVSVLQLWCKGLTSEQTAILNQSFCSVVNVLSQGCTLMMHVASLSICRMIHLRSTIVPCFFIKWSSHACYHYTNDLVVPSNCFNALKKFSFIALHSGSDRVHLEFHCVKSWVTDIIHAWTFASARIELSRFFMSLHLWMAFLRTWMNAWNMGTASIEQ